VKDAEFKRKRKKAYALMAATGVRRNQSIPATYRLLWWLGIKKRPALFASFWSNLILLGGYYAVFWGGMMWFITWQSRGYSPLASVITALAAGLLFGLIMASILRRRRKAKCLPGWEQL
jgi:hypothetical protein